MNILYLCIDHPKESMRLFVQRTPDVKSINTPNQTVCTTDKYIRFVQIGDADRIRGFRYDEIEYDARLARIVRDLDEVRAMARAKR